MSVWLSGTDSAEVRSQRNAETVMGIGAENSGLREVNIPSEQKHRMPLKYTEAKSEPRPASLCLPHGFNKAANAVWTGKTTTHKGQQWTREGMINGLPGYTKLYKRKHNLDLLIFQRQLWSSLIIFVMILSYITFEQEGRV